jgi:hypothetical protein
MEQYDLIASLGDCCTPAVNIRRRFGIHSAMPFDWWVSPYSATIKLLEERFSNLLRPENLAITPADKSGRNSVRCNYYGILHHHDFIRDDHQQVAAGIFWQIPALTRKYNFIIERFLHAVRGKRVLFIRNGLRDDLDCEDPPIPPTEDDTFGRAAVLHSLIRRSLAPRYLDILVLSSIPSGTVRSHEGGRVIYEQLGPRIGDHLFWDANYDLIFDRLGVKIA